MSENTVKEVDILFTLNSKMYRERKISRMWTLVEAFNTFVEENLGIGGPNDESISDWRKWKSL